MFFCFSRLIIDKGKSVLEGDFCCGHRLKALPYDSMPAFLGFDRQRKIASYKTASHLKKRKIREIFGAKDEARLCALQGQQAKNSRIFPFLRRFVPINNKSIYPSKSSAI